MAGDLVTVFGARGTMMIVPAADVGVFTAGVAPHGENSLIAALPGSFAHSLAAAGMPAADVLALTIDAVRGCLAGGPVPRAELAQRVSARLPTLLVPPCRGRCPDPHVEDSLFRLVGTFGFMHFVRDTDLLVAGGEFADIEELRKEFVRRYLRCYGPSRPAALAEWAGISRSDASERLRSVAAECVPGEAVLAESPGRRRTGRDMENASSTGLHFTVRVGISVRYRRRAGLYVRRLHGHLDRLIDCSRSNSRYGVIDYLCLFERFRNRKWDSDRFSSGKLLPIG